MNSKAEILASHRATLDQRNAIACDMLRRGEADFLLALPAGETTEVREWVAARSDDQMEAMVYLAMLGLMHTQVLVFESDAKP